MLVYKEIVLYCSFSSKNMCLSEKIGKSSSYIYDDTAFAGNKQRKNLIEKQMTMEIRDLILEIEILC
jgi:hypothetical protein